MYIDPSTGGALFQALAIAFTAISGTILLFSGRIKMFFSKRRRAKEQAEEHALEENTEE